MGPPFGSKLGQKRPACATLGVVPDRSQIGNFANLRPPVSGVEVREGSRMVRTHFRQPLTVVVAAIILGASATSAAAGDAVTWTSICSGYAGKSYYIPSSGTGYSTTTAADNDRVGAAIRYYNGSTPYSHGNGYAEHKRAAALHGGFHQSYCVRTVTKVSTA